MSHEIENKTCAIKLSDMLADSDSKVIFDEAVKEVVLDQIFGRNLDSFNLDLLANFAASIDSAQYASKNFLEIPRFNHALELITYAIQHSPSAGLNLEFGVFSGRSITHAANTFSQRQFHGFDSFEGLPESWRFGYGKGDFAVQELPQVPHNVELIKGWFDRTLPSFLDLYPTYKVSFLHVDCDLYSSTQTILHQLRDRIVAGTVILFDEYFNYSGWREHEWLAFHEFVNRYGRSYEYIGFVANHQQVAVRILK